MNLDAITIIYRRRSVIINMSSRTKFRKSSCQITLINRSSVRSVGTHTLSLSLVHQVGDQVCQLVGSLTRFQTVPCFYQVYIGSLFLCACSVLLLKTLWEKKKLLVTSNFSFSHSVFHRFWELSIIFIKVKIMGRLQTL